MSKVDAQRAMREAKYARNRASGPTRREAAATAAPPAVPAAAPPAVPAAAPPGPQPALPVTAAAASAPGGERCGHKSMNGRACTREAAHPEKSHRYG